MTKKPNTNIIHAAERPPSSCNPREPPQRRGRSLHSANEAVIAIALFAAAAWSLIVEGNLSAATCLPVLLKPSSRDRGTTPLEPRSKNTDACMCGRERVKSGSKIGRP